MYIWCFLNFRVRFDNQADKYSPSLFQPLILFSSTSDHTSYISQLNDKALIILLWLDEDFLFRRTSLWHCETWTWLCCMKLRKLNDELTLSGDEGNVCLVNGSFYQEICIFNIMRILPTLFPPNDSKNKWNWNNAKFSFTTLSYYPVCWSQHSWLDWIEYVSLVSWFEISDFDWATDLEWLAWQITNDAGCEWGRWHWIWSWTCWRTVQVLYLQWIQVKSLGLDGPLNSTGWVTLGDPEKGPHW